MLIHKNIDNYHSITVMLSILRVNGGGGGGGQPGDDFGMGWQASFLKPTPNPILGL